MDRRHFCKIAALAAGALGLGKLDARAAVPAVSSRLSSGCRVTVARRECYEDLQSLYLDDPETGRCERFTTGENMEFSKGDYCPEGFCPMAFETIRKCVEGSVKCALPSGEGRVMLACCPDGSRPVIFRIELTGEHE